MFDFTAGKVSIYDYLLPIFGTKEAVDKYLQRMRFMSEKIRNILMTVCLHGAQKTEASNEERDDILEEALEEILEIFRGEDTGE